MTFGLWAPNYDTRDRIVAGSWENLRADCERRPPKFIVDCHAMRDGGLYHRIRDYPYLESLLASQFHEVFRAPDGIVYGCGAVNSTR